MSISRSFYWEYQRNGEIIGYITRDVCCWHLLLYIIASVIRPTNTNYVVQWLYNPSVQNVDVYVYIYTAVYFSLMLHNMYYAVSSICCANKSGVLQCDLFEAHLHAFRLDCLTACMHAGGGGTSNVWKVFQARRNSACRTLDMKLYLTHVHHAYRMHELYNEMQKRVHIQCTHERIYVLMGILHEKLGL
jgi:hypothetical protein